jgi:hypothetical protein
LTQEPEAAALWAKSRGVTPLEPDSSFMVLDAGGGGKTVDLLYLTLDASFVLFDHMNDEVLIMHA